MFDALAGVNAAQEARAFQVPLPEYTGGTVPIYAYSCPSTKGSSRKLKSVVVSNLDGSAPPTDNGVKSNASHRPDRGGARGVAQVTAALASASVSGGASAGGHSAQQTPRKRKKKGGGQQHVTAARMAEILKAARGPGNRLFSNGAGPSHPAAAVDTSHGNMQQTDFAQATGQGSVDPLYPPATASTHVFRQPPQHADVPIQYATPRNYKSVSELVSGRDKYVRTPQIVYLPRLRTKSSLIDCAMMF